MAKKSIWADNTSRYGTYTGDRGSRAQWRANFQTVWENSDTVKVMLANTAYLVLGLQVTASPEEIRDAHRRLARLYRQDRCSDENAAKFREVQAAYELLTAKRPHFEPPKMPSQEKHEASGDEEEPQSPPSLQLIIPQLLTEIDVSELDTYLFDDAFAAQEKKDGKHLTLQIKDNLFYVRNKQGNVSTCEPHFERALRLLGRDILVDGEQIKEKFWIWDLLEYDGIDLRPLSYLERYNKLLSLGLSAPLQVLKLATGSNDKKILFENLKKRKKEGIVFKKMSAPFTEGKGLDQLKYKFWATCSVIVVEGRTGKSSIGMELIGTNGREFVGYCSCNRHLPLGSIAEIKYLYAYRGGCLYQPSFKELRDDVNVNECTLSQLKYKSEEDD